MNQNDTPTGGGRQHTLISIGDEVHALRSDVSLMKASLEMALKPIARPSYVNLSVAAIPVAIVLSAGLVALSVILTHG